MQEQKTSLFDQTQPAIWVRIFQFLPLRELVRIETVSHRCYAVTRATWQEIEKLSLLDVFPTTISLMNCNNRFNTMKAAGNLSDKNSFDFSSRTPTIEDVIRILQRCSTNLKSLSFKGLMIRVDGFLLKFISTQFPFLQHLDLSTTCIDNFFNTLNVYDVFHCNLKGLNLPKVTEFGSNMERFIAKFPSLSSLEVSSEIDGQALTGLPLGMKHISAYFSDAAIIWKFLQLQPAIASFNPIPCMKRVLVNHELDYIIAAYLSLASCLESLEICGYCLSRIASTGIFFERLDHLRTVIDDADQIQHLALFTKFCPTLKQVSIHLNCSHLDFVSLSNLKNVKNVRHLSFKSDSIIFWDDSFDTFNVLKKLSLEVGFCNLSFLEGARYISSLSISGCNTLTDEIICKIVENVFCIRKLYVHRCPNFAANKLAYNKRFQTSICKLDFSDCPRIDDYFLQNLHTCSNLKYIGLDRCDGITNEGINYFVFKCSENWTPGRSLILSACHILTFELKTYVPSVVLSSVRIRLGSQDMVFNSDLTVSDTCLKWTHCDSRFVENERFNNRSTWEFNRCLAQTSKQAELASINYSSNCNSESDSVQCN